MCVNASLNTEIKSLTTARGAGLQKRGHFTQSREVPAGPSAHQADVKVRVTGGRKQELVCLGLEEEGPAAQRAWEMGSWFMV